MANNCESNINGNYCLPKSDWSTCKPYQLSQDDKLNCYADSIVDEAVEFAGANINVFKLLGVHEQTKLIDLIGDGKAISGGDAIGFPASNAFTKLKTEWRSIQSGNDAISASAYIGYDFGVVRLPNQRNRYGIDASNRYEITAIKIKQSSDQSRRVTKVRIERSENGQQWYGVAIVQLPDDDQMHTIHFKSTVPNRYWRVRPVSFSHGKCHQWGVQALEMYDYQVTDLSNIQDKIFLENRDREYQTTAITIKGFYEIITPFMNLSQFGNDLMTMMLKYSIKVNFNSVVAKLGRPIVIGDIIELPSEVQYTADLKPIKRFLEVTDVTWDTTTYTPGWQPTMLLVTGQIALTSEETQDLFGDLSQSIDNSGVFSTDDGSNQIYQDLSTISQTINQTALSEVPERGSEGSNTIREFTPEEFEKAAECNAEQGLRNMNFNRNQLYVEDAIPQNGLPYTEGPKFPDNPKDQDYHRMTYEGLSKNVPAKLYRYSDKKHRWIWLETDKRAEYNNQHPVLVEYQTSNTRISAKDVR